MVSGIVAIGVVHRFEAVDVEDGDGEVRLVAQRLPLFVFEKLFEFVAVENAGKRVREGERFKGVFFKFQRPVALLQFFRALLDLFFEVPV